MTREELLNGLYMVEDYIRKINELYQTQVNLQGQYKEIRMSHSSRQFNAKSRMEMLFGALRFWSVAYGVMMICSLRFSFFAILVGSILVAVLLGLVHLTERAWRKGSVFSKVMMVVWGFFVVSYLLEMFKALKAVWAIVLLAAGVMWPVCVERWKKRQTDEENEEIARQNQEIDSKNEEVGDWNDMIDLAIQENVRQIKVLQQQMLDASQSWYPVDYYSLDAVEFFISAVRNYEAGSVKEMVIRFKESEHQKRMEELQRLNLEQTQRNQAYLNEQLRYQNVLSMANLFEQQRTREAVNSAYYNYYN